jgi:hypothetical protein
MTQLAQRIADNAAKPRPRAALKRDELEVGARWLADMLESLGAPRGSFAIALGDGELHVYAGCTEAQWGFSKPDKVAGYRLEWHFGGVYAPFAREAAE